MLDYLLNRSIYGGLVIKTLFSMNTELLLQLVSTFAIIASGPAVIVLLYLVRGNL